MADGSVVIPVEIDISDADKDLAKLKENIKSLEREQSEANKKIVNSEKAVESATKRLTSAQEKLIQLQEKRNSLLDAQSPIATRMEETKIAISEKNAEAENYFKEWVSGVVGADRRQAEAQKKAQELQNEYEKLAQKVEKIDVALNKANTALSEQESIVDDLKAKQSNANALLESAKENASNLARQLDDAKEKAGRLEKELADVAQTTGWLEPALGAADKQMDEFVKRVKSLAKRVFVFTLITSALRGVRTWFGNVVKTNDQAVSAIAKLKGALLTLAQPLVNILVPAFVTLVNVLARVVSTLAQLFAMLTGSTIDASKEAAEALNEQTSALEGTGAAADKASQSLAGFDEINKLSSDTSGASASEIITPDFSFEADATESQLQNILGLVTAVGSAFLAWKIRNALGIGLGKTLLLAVGIYAAVEFVKNIFDAWTNGVNTENVTNMLLAAVVLATALGLALGPVAAGIALVVTGLAMLVTGFQDAYKNGWNLNNLLLVIAGILAAGVGIAILVGSWIPAAIAGIVALLTAITVAFGEGENLVNGAKQILDGFIDFFVGIFTGDFDRAVRGIGDIFGGLQKVFDAVLNALRNMITSFFTWLDQKTGGKMTGIINLVRDLMLNGVQYISEIFTNGVSFWKSVLENLIVFLSGVFAGDWDRALSGLVEIGRSIFNTLITFVESFVNFFVRGLNTVIKAINSLSFNVPDWVPGIGGETLGDFGIRTISELKLPRLAQGAVIPPNREFMAVLGDQTSGNNLEAPESLIRKIVREEAGGMNTDLLEEILEAIKAGRAIYLDGRQIAKNSVRHINSMTQESGAPVLLV